MFSKLPNKIKLVMNVLIFIKVLKMQDGPQSLFWASHHLFAMNILTLDGSCNPNLSLLSSPIRTFKTVFCGMLIVVLVVSI